MGHTYLNGTAWIRIPPEYVERMYALGDEAIERLRSFGLDDRRESAWSLIVAGAVPLLGMLLLGWSAAAAVVCLVANLLIGIADDLWKILRGRGPLYEMTTDCAADQFVWPLARALARASRTVYGKSLPTLDDLDTGRSQAAPFMFAFMALVGAGFPAWIIQADAGLQVQPGTVVVGVLPSFVLFLGASIVHAAKHHPHWRRAGSVRLATTTGAAMMTLFLGMGSMLAFLVQPGPEGSGTGFALVACLTPIAWGNLRLINCAHLQRAARWMERAIAANRRAAEAPPAPRAPERPADFAGFDLRGG